MLFSLFSQQDGLVCRLVAERLRSPLELAQLKSSWGKKGKITLLEEEKKILQTFNFFISIIVTMRRLALVL